MVWRQTQCLQNFHVLLSITMVWFSSVGWMYFHGYFTLGSSEEFEFEDVIFEVVDEVFEDFTVEENEDEVCFWCGFFFSNLQDDVTVVTLLLWRVAVRAGQSFSL